METRFRGQRLQSPDHKRHRRTRRLFDVKLGDRIPSDRIESLSVSVLSARSVRSVTASMKMAIL